MLPETNDLIDLDEEESTIPSRTYKIITSEDDSEERIIGYIDDETEAIKQSVNHILNTERYIYDIYDDDYGIELDQYIGEDFEFLNSTIKETLEDALTQDDRITGVEIINLEKIDGDKVHILFNVQTKANEIEMEVDIDV